MNNGNQDDTKNTPTIRESDLVNSAPQESPGKMLFIGVGVLMLLLGFLGGYLIWGTQNDNEDVVNNEISENSDPIDEISEEEWKTYTNEEVGIQFNVPIEWLDLIVDKRGEEESSEYYDGSHVRIASNQKPFAFFAYTPDFVAYGSETGGLFYRGQKDLNCADREEYTKCEEFVIQGRRGISYFYIHHGVQGGIYSTERHVLINNPGQKYTGLAFLIEFPSLEHDRIDLASSMTFEEYKKNISEMLAENRLSDENQALLRDFEDILSSVQFTQ